MKKVSFPLNVPKEVQLLQAAFQEADQELFLVGGCVRDAVLNKPAKDYDLVTSALPDHVEEILQDFPTKAVGKSFGVILVSVNGQEFEVATFRKDGQYSDGRHPDQVEFSTLEEDAFRRDLTINALYYNLKTQEVWDFHRGLEDLKNKKTKFVGQALDRLKEDKLRALRFVRFHGRLNAGAYHTLDQEAAKAIQQVVLAPDISGERIRDEFLKGLESVLNQQNFLYNLNDLGLLPQIFPDLEMFLFVKQHLTDPKMILAQLLAENQHLAKKLLALKYSAQEAMDIEFLSVAHTLKDIVQFAKERRKCLLSNEELISFFKSVYPNWQLLTQMTLYPYPTVRGEAYLDQFQGRALGEHLAFLERENFKKFLSSGTLTHPENSNLV